MAVAVNVPNNLWEEDSEAVITNWLVGNGGAVAEGQLIAEIMVEKVQHEIRSPASGTITIGKPAKSVVSKGTEIATIA